MDTATTYGACNGVGATCTKCPVLTGRVLRFGYFACESGSSNNSRMKVLSIDENKGVNGDDEEEDEEDATVSATVVVAAVDIRFINARDDIVYCM